MGQELVYTSVPKGLKPGSKGFCTVAMTASLTGAWPERLESLSGYRPVYPLGDAQSDQNPVNWSHWRVAIGNKTRSVLSRVSFAGADYSQRSNKLAHHIVLEASEQAPGGPAWMMLQSGFMRVGWKGEPTQLPELSSVPRGDRPSSPCLAWAKTLGDPAWGAFLAAAFANEPSKPAYLVYAPGINVLSLFDESLSLLPPEQRWNVTFSTFFTELPLNLNCSWRAVVAGTPAAIEAARLGPRAVVLDLTNPKNTAIPTGAFADAARNGTGPVLRSAPVAVFQTPDDSAVGTTVAEETSDTGTQAEPGYRKRRLTRGTKSQSDEPAYEVTPEPAPEFVPTGMSHQTIVRRGVSGWMIAATALLSLPVGGIIGYMLGKQNADVPIAMNIVTEPKPITKPTGPTSPPKTDESKNGENGAANLGGAGNPGVNVITPPPLGGVQPDKKENGNGANNIKESDQPKGDAHGNSDPVIKNKTTGTSAASQTPVASISKSALDEAKRLNVKVLKATSLNFKDEGKQKAVLSLGETLESPSGIALLWPNNDLSFGLIKKDGNSIQLVAEPSSTSDPLKFQIKASKLRTTGTTAWVAMEIELVGSDIHFRWTADANKQTDSLQNIKQAIEYSVLVIKTKDGIHKYCLKKFDDQSLVAKPDNTFDPPVPLDWFKESQDVSQYRLSEGDLTLVPGWNGTSKDSKFAFAKQIEGHPEMSFSVNGVKKINTKWQVSIEVGSWRKEVATKLGEEKNKSDGLREKMLELHINEGKPDEKERRKKYDALGAKKADVDNEIAKIESRLRQWSDECALIKKASLLGICLPNNVRVMNIPLSIPEEKP